MWGCYCSTNLIKSGTSSGTIQSGVAQVRVESDQTHESVDSNTHQGFASMIKR